MSKFRIYYIAKRHEEYDRFVTEMAQKCAESGVPFNRREVVWIYSKIFLYGRRFESRREIAFGESWREVCDLDFINSRIDGPDNFFTKGRAKECVHGLKRGECFVCGESV